MTLRCAGLMAALVLLGPSSAWAVDAQGQIENPALQARYETLTRELRCLVCQNESVADSDASLARDLRAQVQQMLIAGRSDEQILAFMTDRYGEFVRYRPPLEGKTLLLWGAPFILMLVGFLSLWRIMRRRSVMPIEDDPPPGS